ncbi:DUF2163 domain-containing protein [Mesorhizobium sp. M7A.F.Ca.ET.027.02.1.1]|uniref:DUF2163 domain-containing protein n=1 Tax=Mesorhizobium sp. M7A.F.Ca.ET.027.02.1.1 TaxID=2496655 RepID=UPI000FD18C30|nr:DUF2163 domain-containing protein [Mesorhizobium sp. M7A.F.Ca.ET.027.02.1.1]RVD16860.1 DUF2163 domain-containing protein [Mesorhizobium sp. M7A.F.Ca.ET.027.02.1.1]
MRLTSSGLKAAMSATPHTLGWLGKFVFADGTTIRVSATGKKAIFDSETWPADKSFKGSTLKFSGDGSVPDGEVTAPAAISDAYDSEDVYAGTFEGMQITLYVFNHADPSVGGMQLGPYTAAEISYDDRGRIAVFEVRGILQRAKEITVEELSVSCRSDLGDQRPGFCNLPLYPNDVARSTAYAVGNYVRVSDAGNYHNRMFRCTTAGATAGSAPAYNYTVAATTTDGTAVFTAEEAWVRSGVIATHTDDSDFTATLTESRAVDGWFTNGVIKWTSGQNAGLYNQFRAWTQSSSRIRIWGAARWPVAVADTFEIVPGCDKTFAMCKTRFSSSINFRGENRLPGLAFLNGAGL